MQLDGFRRLTCPRCKGFATVVVGYDAKARKMSNDSMKLVCDAKCGEPPYVLPDPHLHVPDNDAAARWYPQEAE